MSGVAYFRGAYVPLAEARLSVSDLGIVQGATVTERLRTFRFQPFALREHLDRLGRSLEAVGFEPDESAADLAHIVQRVIAENRPGLPDDHDLAVVIFVTAGDPAIEPLRPTVCVHTHPLAFAPMTTKYRIGERLAIPHLRQIPPEIIDPRIKHRSRLHWRLADREARRIDPEASALLLDADGFATETAVANVFVVTGDRLRTPQGIKTLNGVSQSFVRQLAADLGWNVEEADLSVDDLRAGDELLLSSTSYCLAPVTRLEGRPVGGGVPGPVWRQLIDAWSQRVGVDIVGQAARAAQT